MAEVVLADSGAIVAVLDRRDQHHQWASERFNRFTAPCQACEAVISECFFLLDHLRDGQRRFCDLLERQVIEVNFSFPTFRSEVLRLIARYADLPMSFADACLVRMSELHRTCRVFTTDSHFKVYRRNRREIIPVIAPW